MCFLAHPLSFVYSSNQSKMKSNLIIALLLSSLSLPVMGQSTLDDCIRYAWANNPGFKNTRIDVKEAHADYVAAIGKFLLDVSMQAEVGRHIGRSVDPGTNGYTSDSYNQGTAGMDVTLSLYHRYHEHIKTRSFNQLQIVVTK